MTNKFISVLDKIGAIGKEIFKVVLPVAEAVEPEVAILFPALAPLYNMTVTLVSNAEAAAAAAGANTAGPQKLALVLAALLPYATQEATALGIKAPTVTEATAWVNSVVAGLKALGAVA